MNSSSPPHELQFMSSGQTHELQFIQVQSKEESTERIPYGMSLRDESRALARPKGAAPCARSALAVEEKISELGALRRADINAFEEAQVPESKEQREQRLNRQIRRKSGQSTFGSELNPKIDGGSESSPRRKTANQRGAGPPPTGPGSSSEHRSTEEHRNAMTNNPKDVSAVPGDPWGLYTHFLKVVKAKYPNSQSSGHNKKILARGKQLLQDFNPVRIYEMIQVLVLDFESFGIARVFLKFSGSAVPTFDQLCSNTDVLSSFVGTGLISPPSVRRSPYAEDYAKRHEKTTGDSGVKDSVDHIKELRDKVNRTNK